MVKIKLQSNTARETSLYSLCRSHSLFLKEQALNGRLLAVVMRSEIIIKEGLDHKMKRFLVHKSIVHMKNNPQCKIAIYLKNYRDFFILKSV